MKRIDCVFLAGCLLGASVHGQPARAAEHEKTYFIARTNVPTWMIHVQNVGTKQVEEIDSEYISGDSYIAVKLSPGTYKLIQYGQYDNQVVLPKANVQLTVFDGCTNYYGRLDLFEDGSVLPGKAVVSSDGTLDVRALRNLGVRIKALFVGKPLCVSGERDDFRFEWDAIRKYIEK
jgi:hypothetical protein